MDIEKTIVNLEATNKEAVDLENIPIEEVFEHLKCNESGLSTDKVQVRLSVFGYSKMEENKESKILKLFGFMWNPLSKAKVLRDSKWCEEDTSVLVPGDVISIKLGDIIPADAQLLQGDPLKIDQTALTGESLPVTKHPGDLIYFGSTCKKGEIEAVVIATGLHTFSGKAAHLVKNTTHALQAIGNFCICFIATGRVL